MIRENWISKGKFKNWMFKDSIEIFQGLIKFIEGSIARKNYFEFNLVFN